MFLPIPNPCTTECAQQAISSWPDIIKTVASVLALPLALLTFWLGYRQREHERTLSYYHKVVVDALLPKILEGFAVEIDRMQEAGREALVGLKSSRKAMPRKCSIALADFATNLFGLQDLIAERTLIFDEKITNEIKDDFQGTQDDVTDWFSDVILHKQRHFEEIEQILRLRQRQLIKRLYRGEFRDF
jgi:hypothetical protein